MGAVSPLALSVALLTPLVAFAGSAQATPASDDPTGLQPPDPIPVRHRSQLEDLQAFGTEWYGAVVTAPSLVTNPLPPSATMQPTLALCDCTTARAAAAAPLRAFGLLTYMRFPHLRAGLGLQLTYNDPGTPIAWAPAPGTNDGSAYPVSMLAVTGNAFVDAETHWGPFVPYAGLDLAGGVATDSMNTGYGSPETVSRSPFAYLGGRAGVHLYIGADMAIGAFIETSLLGPRFDEAGVSWILPEIASH